MRRRVYLASPWRGNHSRNADYALAALRDSLRRGEAPFASHVQYASCGVLDDDVEAERIAGIEAGAAWLAAAEAVVVYQDRPHYPFDAGDFKPIILGGGRRAHVG